MATRATRKRLSLDRLARMGSIRCVSQKMTYDTYAEAFDAAERQMDRGLVWPGCHIQPYRCSTCGYWHTANHRVMFRS